LLLAFSVTADRVVEMKSIGVKEITAYHAITAECDSAPDIGAGGRVAINGVPTGRWCAANFLPMGTRIMIPRLTGDIIWQVRDRTARKVGHRVDLLIPPGAAGIGLRRAEVFVVKGAK
jgi:hypothetical protein